MFEWFEALGLTPERITAAVAVATLAFGALGAYISIRGRLVVHDDQDHGPILSNIGKSSVATKRISTVYSDRAVVKLLVHTIHPGGSFPLSKIVSESGVAGEYEGCKITYSRNWLPWWGSVYGGKRSKVRTVLRKRLKQLLKDRLHSGFRQSTFVRKSAIVRSMRYSIDSIFRYLPKERVILALDHQQGESSDIEFIAATETHVLAYETYLPWSAANSVDLIEEILGHSLDRYDGGVYKNRAFMFWISHSDLRLLNDNLGVFADQGLGRMEYPKTLDIEHIVHAASNPPVNNVPSAQSIEKVIYRRNGADNINIGRLPFFYFSSPKDDLIVEPIDGGILLYNTKRKEAMVVKNNGLFVTAREDRDIQYKKLPPSEAREVIALIDQL